MKSNIIIILFFFYTKVNSLIVPDGKYCGNVIGNEIDITFYSNMNLSDISANIFRKKYNCNDEKYTYDPENKIINMPNDKNDCLNKVLEKYKLCPCPPDIKYDDTNNIIDVYTDDGDISMISC